MFMFEMRLIRQKNLKRSNCTKTKKAKKRKNADNAFKSQNRGGVDIRGRK
jgi:hypothetical protein